MRVEAATDRWQALLVALHKIDSRALYAALIYHSTMIMY